MITAVIAEKPSVAKDIASVLNVRERHDGYLSGNGYLVTWAFGHLVQLAMPEAYGYTGFRRENLPILPQEFKYIPRQIREGKEYKPDLGVLKQLKVIKEVFDRSDRIVVATDAGREGEAIHRYIYNYLGCRKPCLRLWISSLTDRAIREGLDNLRPGSDYDNLYRAAEARAIADWEIGLNATQALSIAAGQGIYSLGRVQTPTLMMICSRYLENRDFTPQTYFRLKITAEKDGTPFAAISELRYETLPAANAALAKIESGEMNPDTFRKGIEVYAAQITEELLQVQVSVADGRHIPCPKCRSGRILLYPKVAKCSNVDCGLTVFRGKGEKQLTDSQIADLVTKGKTSLIKGFRSRDGKPFDAYLTFDKDFRTVYGFPPRTDKPKGKERRR